MKHWAVAALSLFCLPLSAQHDVETTVRADLVSKYMWRGLDLGGVSIQPQAKLSWRGLFARTSGSVGFAKEDDEEIDFEIGYSLHGFNIGLIDYWRTGIDPDDRFLYFDREKGAHRAEGNLGYTCKYFSLQGYTTVWGKDDKLKEEKRAYSTYIEAAVPFKLGGVDWVLRGGFSPFESHGEEKERQRYSEDWGDVITIQYDKFLYADKAAFVLASLRATKEINLGREARMPIFAEIHMNPYLQKANVVLGISIIPF
jgi:hypothetical protein